ncbi:MAG: cytochrome c [Thermoactinomyces sp.]
MKRAGLTLAVCGVLLLAGCSAGGNDTGKQNGTSTAQTDPKEIYMSNCASCHGGNLQGATGPNLQQVGAKLNKEQILQILQNGQGTMPAQSHISADERDQLATWLSEKK